MFSVNSLASLKRVAGGGGGCKIVRPGGGGIIVRPGGGGMVPQIICDTLFLAF